MTSGQRTGLESSPACVTNDRKIIGLASPSTVGRPQIFQFSKTNRKGIIIRQQNEKNLIKFEWPSLRKK